jgi:sec-independent protein translocase protein TatA
MPFQLGMPELLVILVIVIVLFGVGRLGALGAELGKAIRSFRQGLNNSGAEEEASHK